MAVAPGALSDAAAPNSDYFRYSKECKRLLPRSGHAPGTLGLP